MSGGAERGAERASEGVVPEQLAQISRALRQRSAPDFTAHVLAFVHTWQGARDQMESNEVFVDTGLMELLAVAIGEPEISWYALKLGCLLARSDSNSLALLRAGGVGAVLETLNAHWPDESASRVEAALALMQNIAYSNEGVTAILHAGGVSVVLAVMSAHMSCATVQQNGLGVLLNLCDSEEHWEPFLSEGPSMPAVLLETMQCHPENRRIEESVVDTLWDISSTSEGQAHILTAGGIPPILQVMTHQEQDKEFLKKGLSMLWQLSISSSGITAIVLHDGVSAVLEIMTRHAASEEIQQNALGVLRNISDLKDGQEPTAAKQLLHYDGILVANGLPIILNTLRVHAACDEIVELALECLTNICQGSLQNSLSLVLEGVLELLHSDHVRASASLLRRYIAQELPRAAPMLGAILHASEGSELKRNVLIGLAFIAGSNLDDISPSAAPPAPGRGEESVQPRDEAPGLSAESPAEPAERSGLWAGRLLLRLRGVRLLGDLLRSDDTMLRRRGAEAVRMLMRVSSWRGSCDTGLGAGRLVRDGANVQLAHDGAESGIGCARAASSDSSGATGPGRGSSLPVMGEHESATKNGALHDFSGYLDDRGTADVIFWVDGQCIYAHRIVLLCSLASEVFRAMLRHPMREASTAEVEVKDIDFEVFRLLLEYLYTGEVVVPPRLAAQLLLAAERYMVYALQYECVRAFVSQLSSASLWEAMHLASLLHMVPPEGVPTTTAMPAHVMREAVVEFLCDTDELGELVSQNEFFAHASTLVPKLEARMESRLAFAITNTQDEESSVPAVSS